MSIFQAAPTTREHLRCGGDARPCVGGGKGGYMVRCISWDPAVCAMIPLINGRKVGWGGAGSTRMASRLWGGVVGVWWHQSGEWTPQGQCCCQATKRAETRPKGPQSG